jgi:trans-aconitate 2-methyltransferase
VQWDPEQYARYADERARPFLDLLQRVGARSPRRVVDIGCGPGTLTALLRARWPDAQIDGVDSSPAMIATAAPLAGPTLRFHHADAVDWQLPPDTDVVITNATLQWVPSHRALLDRWSAQLPAGGWLGVQVPGNFDAPSHVLMRHLAADRRWADTLRGVLRHDDAVAEPADYARQLLAAGLSVDVWSTTYVHVLGGADPVLEWVRGTALRPVLAALDERQAAQFEADYAVLLRTAYPPTDQGTLFPFRRIFVVAHRPPVG